MGSGGNISATKVKVTDFISEYYKHVLHQVHSNFHTHQQCIKILISPICANAEYYYFYNLCWSDRKENGFSLLSNSHLLVMFFFCFFKCVPWLLYWSFAHFLFVSPAIFFYHGCLISITGC